MWSKCSGCVTRGEGWLIFPVFLRDVIYGWPLTKCYFSLLVFKFPQIWAWWLLTKVLLIKPGHTTVISMHSSLKRQGCFSWGIFHWHCNVVLAQSNLKRAPAYGAKGYHHNFYPWLRFFGVKIIYQFKTPMQQTFIGQIRSKNNFWYVVGNWKWNIIHKRTISK